MRRAIRKHLGDFAAILALVAIALGVGAYILDQQRLRLPLLEDEPFQIRAEFSDAQGVIPGQGQTVRVAGVRIGDVAKVELEDGLAVVTMDVDREFERVAHADATAVLRPRTGLKDMFVELDPGSSAAPVLDDGDTIPARNTAPDIDPDEVLSALDRDTRDYLKLLVSGAGKGLEGRGGDLREVLRRFEPLHRDLARVTEAIAERRRNLRRLVHNYAELTDELADKDRELTRLVEASSTVFRALATEDASISRAVRKLPSALGEAASTLAKVETLGRVLGPSLDSLRPAFRALDRANRGVLPLAREGEPILREQIRPFVRAARPYLADLRPAARDLVAAAPDVTAALHEVNRLVNMAAFNEGGAEQLSGELARDTRRNEGYLFWLAWAAQNGSTLFSTADAQGNFRKVFVQATCTTAFETLVAEEPALAALTGLQDLLADASICPETGG